MNSSNKISTAARLLREASQLLEESGGESGVDQNPSINSDSLRTIAESVNRTRQMLTQSASTGVFRRLNQAERKRTASNSVSTSLCTRKRKTLKERAFDFALIMDHDEDEPSDTLKWDSIIADGVVMLVENDSETIIRQKITSALSKKYPLMCTTDFLFLKIRQKKISVPELSGTEFNYAVIKKIVGQGTLYVKLKKHLSFVLNTEDEDQLETTQSTLAVAQSAPSTTTRSTPPTTTQSTPPTTTQSTPTTATQSTRTTQSTPTTATQSTTTTRSTPTTIQSTSLTATQPASPETVQTSINASPIIITDNGNETNHQTGLVTEITQLCIHDPVEILRFLQKRLCCGRPLFVRNILDNERSMEGFVNQICVDRDDIITSTFYELKSITDYKLTFQIDFIGESAQDYGGPRMEWIGLMNRGIQEKYFENGLKEHLMEDYFYVGVMVGISLIQGGIVPYIFNEEALNQIFDFETVNNEVIYEVLRGMDEFKLKEVFKNFPVLKNIFYKSITFKLNPKFLLDTIKAKFSSEGSTVYSREKKIYTLFVRYLREVASGRRGNITLGDILQFVTGCEDMPLLGFSEQPTMKFALSDFTQVIFSNFLIVFDSTVYNFIDAITNNGVL